MLDRGLIEREFGFLNDSAYLNWCMVGAPPMRVQKISNGFMDDYITRVRENNVDYGDSRANCRALAARLIGAESDEIALVGNTTGGMSILASGYPLGPGDNVISCDLENASCIYPFIAASRTRGFEMRIIRTKDGRIPADDVIARIDGNTKIVALSFVQAGTGYKTDIARISAACARHGAVLAVDAIQALGRLDVNVRRLGIDFLSSAAFKGLLAGFGTGFMYCRRELICRITPPYVSAQNTTYSPVPPAVLTSAADFTFACTAKRFEAGSHNTYGVLCLESSLGLINELGIAEIDGHVTALEARLRGRLVTAAPFGQDEPSCWSGNVVMLYPEKLYARAEEIISECGLVLTHRPGYVRLSINAYNTPGHVDLAADALDRIASL